jgi:KDO2-lipid IV(A) lauroyltransferase
MIILLLRGLAAVFRSLPAGVALAAGRLLGDLARAALPGRRRVVMSNLQAALGDRLDPAALSRLGRANYRHYGVVLAEFLRLPLLDDGALLDCVAVTGLDHVRDARARGRGLIVLTAHTGNWEYLAAAQAAWGLDIAVITRRAGNRQVDAFWQDLRRRRGTRFLESHGSMGEIMRHLRTGGAVGMAIDQHEGGTSGVRAPFFGRDAGTVKAPAVLAARLGCPVIMALSWRDDDGRHHASFSPELPLVEGRDLPGTVALTTASYNAKLEQFVRDHPEQWTWIHRRWKPAPAAPR